jgi:Arc/MetJ-type ribon-helix-helix transcriptional regulator
MTMGSIKRTYVLPPELLEQFEGEVEPGRRSAVITELLRRWLEERRRQRLRAQVIEGCHEMAEVMLEIEQEFCPLDEEIDRALDAASEAR